MTRPEMVENGIKFLRHPNVQSTPLSERVSFLEQKGMTKDEIQEAIERYQSEPDLGLPAAPPAPAAAQVVAAAAPMVAAAAAPVQQFMRRRQMPTYMRVLLTISSVVGAATILGFLWNYMVHAGYFPWFNSSRRMLEAAKNDEEEAEASANEKQSETALLSSLHDVSNAIQTQTQELTKLCTAIDTKEDEFTRNRSTKNQISSTIAEQATVQAIAELKAEVSTLKALLVAGASGAVATASAVNAITSSDSSAKIPSPLPLTPSTSVVATPEPVEAKETSAQRMQTALKKFRQENTVDQLKLASGILIMYVKNLVENPDVPRYRRIAPANANFKQKIEPLKHHDELLKSIGFESTGLNMEWKWHLLDRSNGEFDEHLAILKALLKALQAVSKANSGDILALEEIAQQSLDAFHAEQSEKKDVEKTKEDAVAGEACSTTSATKASTTTSTTTSVVEKKFTTASTSQADTDLQAFLSRLEQKTNKSFEESKAASVVSTVESSSTVEDKPSTATGLVPVHDDDEEKAPIPVASDETSPVENSPEPPYPKSFTEVMEMIKKGEPVPGIQQIEERISDDAAKFLSEEKTDVATGTTAVAAAAATAKPWEKR